MTSTLQQRSADWEAARRGKITASLAAACLGMHPHISRQKAWRIITGRQETEWNAHMRRGVEYEQAARTAYEIESGNLVVETGFWIHPDLLWLGASPDGLVRSDGLVEIKCPKECHSEVPSHYRVQMLVQLACTKRSWCDYWCFAADGFWLGKVRIDEHDVDKLIVDLDKFRRDYLLTDTQPPRKGKGE